MRLRKFALIVLLVAGPAWPAQKAAAPESAAPKLDATFSIGHPLPKWVQPMAEVPPTTRRDPVVVRLFETQAWVGANPAITMSRAYQVNEQAVLGEIGQFGLSYFPSYQKLSLHRLAILRNGQVLDRTAVVKPRMLQREQNLENGVVGGATTVQLLLDDVRVGDTLWLTYTIEGENPVFGKRWSNDFSWDSASPIELRRLTIMHPRQRPLYWRQLGDFNKEQIKPSVEQAGDIERIRFEQKGIEAVEAEPSVPADYFSVRVLQVSEHPDWHSVAGWAASLFPPAAPSAPLRQLAQQFAGEPDQSARAAAALHWVQDEIRYFSVSIGENSHRPQPPETVLKRRYGDCKDKSYLLVSLLAQLGIKAEPVLINAQAPKVAAKLTASPSWFDHVIVRIDLDGKSYYVDPTQNGQKGALAQLPVPFPGGFGLAVNPASEALTALPERPEALVEFEHVEKFVIASFDGKATLESRDIYRGAWADHARRRFPIMSSSELKKNVLGQYEKLYPGVSLEEPPRLADKAGEGSFEVQARLALPKAVTHEDGKYKLEYASQVVDGTLGIPNNVVRSFPFALPQGKFKGRYRLTVAWPDTVRHQGEVSARTIDNRFFKLHEEYAFRSNYLDYLLDYAVGSDQVAAPDLPALQVEAKKLNQYTDASFRVADFAVVEPAGLGFSLRDTEVARDIVLLDASLRDWKAGPNKQLDPNEACEFLRRAATLRTMGLLKQRDPFEVLEQSLRNETRPGMKRCLAALLFAERDFGASASVFAEDKSIKDDDPLVARLAWSRLYSGDAQGAAGDIGRFVAARIASGELNALDMAGAVALLRRAGRPLPASLAERVGALPDGPWPRPVLAMQAGAITPEALLELAGKVPGTARELAQGDAWFYIGQQRLAQGDRAGAAAAFRWLLANAVRSSDGYVQAQAELDKLKSNDIDYLAGVAAAQRSDYQTAFAALTRSAERGVPEAQERLGRLYYYGRGTAKDMKQAWRLFKLAADKDIGDAHNMLGVMLGLGEGGAVDELAGVEAYRRAAALGDEVGAYNLGSNYISGHGVAMDAAKGVTWLRLAAELDHSDAQAKLARHYAYGDGVQQDFAQAAFWASIASDRGNDLGHVYLGRLLWSGDGVAKDPVAGTALIRRAAQNGNPDGEYFMGEAYGSGTGVPRDDKQAVAWYLKAARAGYHLAEWRLGTAYRNGLGVQKDAVQAHQWYEKAAAAGVAIAHTELGDLFRAGIGVEVDLKRAFAHYRQAAEAGDRDGQLMVGNLLRDGHGVEKNPVEAVAWTRKASAAGSASATNNLGDMYENGVGVGQDYAQAIRLYRQAVRGGSCMGMLSLGSLYEQGKGVDQDLPMAYTFYQLAHRLGEPNAGCAEASTRRDAVAKRLPSDQLAFAEAATAAWKDGQPLPDEVGAKH